MNEKDRIVKMLIEKGEHDLAMEFLEKHDPSGDMITPVHGTGGIFSAPATNPNMLHTILSPDTWITRLPLRRTQVENEYVEILTEQEDTSGDNADDFCDVGPIPGNLKRCRTKSIIGKFKMMSKEMIVPEAGLLRDAAEVERNVLNARSLNDPWLPDMLSQPNINFRDLLAQGLFELRNAIHRSLALVEVNGDHTTLTASAEKGWIREPDGLALLIKDGHTDEDDGEACAAADSLVEDWNNGDVEDTVGGLDIVSFLTEMAFSRMTLAQDLGLSATWRFVGDKRLFRELAFKFASTYAGVRYPAASDSLPVNRAADSIESRFREMMTNRYLLIDGMPVEYVFTSGAEASAGGLGHISDLFLECYQINGAPNTWIEYWPLDNPFTMQFVGSEFNTVGRRVMNNGLYLSALRSTDMCDQVSIAMLPRIMHFARFLSARLDNITYRNYRGYRGWQSTDSFAGGGIDSFEAA